MNKLQRLAIVKTNARNAVTCQCCGKDYYYLTTIKELKTCPKCEDVGIVDEDELYLQSQELEYESTCLEAM